MKPKPDSKDGKTPVRRPPPTATLEARGLELRKTKLQERGEDGVRAYERARLFDWGSRIVDPYPYRSSGFWLWIVRREPEAA